MNPGDQRLVNYFLEHSFKTIFDENYNFDLWSPPFFYPYKNVLAFSENMLGTAPIYWILRFFFQYDIAFQIWSIVILSLDFIIFAFLMRKLNVSHIFSALSAFLFAFGITRMGQFDHLQLMPNFFTPLFFIFFIDFLKNPDWKKLALSFFIAYLQVLSGIYLGWFLLFSIPIFYILVLTNRDYREAQIIFLKNKYIHILIIFVLWSVLIFLTLYPYLQIYKLFGKWEYSIIDSMLPRINSYFFPTFVNFWSPVLTQFSKDLPMSNEHHLFPGFIIILLVLLTIYLIVNKKLPKKEMVISKFCFYTFAILTILSFRFPIGNGISLWKIVYNFVPGASAIRAVTRISLISYFFLFISIFICLDKYVNQIFNNKKVKIIIIFLFCFLTVCEQIVFFKESFDKEVINQSINEISVNIDNKCDTAYFSWDTSEEWWKEQISAMWAGLIINLPVINGNSGHYPPNYKDFTQPMTINEVVYWLKNEKPNFNGVLCIVVPRSIAEQEYNSIEFALEKSKR